MLNETIKTLRKEHNLTLKQLGEILGVSESAMCHYESGRRTPSTDIVMKLASYFNVSLDFLYKDEFTQAEHNDSVFIPPDIAKMIHSSAKERHITDQEMFEYIIQSYLDKENLN